MKRAAVKNLESNIEELKSKSSQQLDENSRLEDKIRELTVAITTQEAQCDKLRHMVSIEESICVPIFEAFLISQAVQYCVELTFKIRDEAY